MPASKRGRPPIYASEFDRREARIEHVRDNVQNFTTKTKVLLGDKFAAYESLRRWVYVHPEIRKCFPPREFPKLLRDTLLGEMPSSPGDREEWAFQNLADAYQELVTGNESKARQQVCRLNDQMQLSTSMYAKRVSATCLEVLRDLGQRADDLQTAFECLEEQCRDIARRWVIARDPLRLIAAMIILGNLHSHYQRTIESVTSPAMLYFDAAGYWLERITKRNALRRVLLHQLHLRKAEHLTMALCAADEANRELQIAQRLAEDEIGSAAVLHETYKELVDFHTAFRDLDKAQAYLRMARDQMKQLGTNSLVANVCLRQREISLLIELRQNRDARALIRDYAANWERNPCAFQGHVLKSWQDRYGGVLPRASVPLRLKAGISFFFSGDWLKGCVLR